MEIDYTEMKVIKEKKQGDIKIEVKRFKTDEEVFLLVRSKQKIVKEKSMRSRVENLFVERLEYYKKGLTIPRRTKKYKNILELIGRLKEKYPKAAKLYNVEVTPEDKSATKKNLLAKDIIWKKKEGAYKENIEKEGSYILRSNRSGLKDEEIWKTYVMLTNIEDSFKNLKSHLGLRPNFHQKEGRVDGHMFISVIAYHILHIIEYKLKQKGDTRSWNTIKKVLSTHERTTILYKTKEEDGLVKQELLRASSVMEPEHLEIYRKLGLSGVPLKRKKMKSK